MQTGVFLHCINCIMRLNSNLAMFFIQYKTYVIVKQLNRRTILITYVMFYYYMKYLYWEQLQTEVNNDIVNEKRIVLTLGFVFCTLVLLIWQQIQTISFPSVTNKVLKFCVCRIVTVTVPTIHLKHPRVH